MEDFKKDINGIAKQIEEVSTKLENDFASKKDLEKVADALSAYEKISQKQALESKKDRVFGDKAVAKEACDYMAGVLAKKGLFKDGVFGMTKAGLDTVTSTRGADDFVPTATADRIEYLLNQGGVARQNATVYSGLRGSLEIPTVTDQVVVAEKTDSDASSFSEVQNTSGTVTLNPRLFGALYRSSLKLVYESSPAVAALIIEQLANAMAVKEDTEAVAAIVASSIDKTISASAVASEDVIDLLDKVHESVNPSDPNVKYFMNRTTWSQLKKLLKNSEANNYMIDFEQGQYAINGVPVVLWHRVPSFADSAIADDCPVLYGDMRKAVAIGIGRDMQVDIDFGGTNFDKGQAAWRLMEDYDVEVVQPGALAGIIDPSS